MSVAKIEILIKTTIIFPKKIAVVFRDFSKLSLFCPHKLRLGIKTAIVAAFFICSFPQTKKTPSNYHHPS